MRSSPSTSSDAPTRRGAAGRLARSVAGLAALLALGACVSTPLTVRPPYGRVTVDVSALRDKGLGLYADRVQAGMADAAGRMLGGVVNPADRNAPTLVLQITSVSFTEPMTNGDTGPGESTDYMEGAALIVVGGKVVDRVPMLGGYTSRWSQALNPMGDPLRLQGLCDFWVGWMRKKLGG